MLNHSRQQMNPSLNRAAGKRRLICGLLCGGVLLAALTSAPASALPHHERAASRPTPVANALPLVPLPPPAPAPDLQDLDEHGDFLTALCRDAAGRTWAATEGQGLFCYDPAAPTNQKWSNYTAATTGGALPEDDAYALCADARGRVWVGLATGGVAVLSGADWQTYDRLRGPLGAHVTALAVSPVDGAVWGATEAGLFRYANDKWSYFTRAEGLPSDQATGLAFGRNGRLYVAMACDGLAIGSPGDGYRAWRHVPGPASVLTAPVGRGLPSALTNCVLVAKDGVVYVGTDGGLAWSRDGGLNWRYVRGADYGAKCRGLLHPVEPVSAGKGPLLLEDYVTSLAEDGSGHVVVGHRQRGVEIVESGTLRRVWPVDKASDADKDVPEEYVSSLLPCWGGTVLVGRYGGGLGAVSASGVPVGGETGDLGAAPANVPFPVAALPPTMAKLQAMQAQVQSLRDTLPAGSGAYLGEDWQTEGDAIGHYGRQYACLFSIASPLDQVVTWSRDYKTDAQMGPHHSNGDSLRHWISFSHTQNGNALYSPVDGFRTQAEIDDHGESVAEEFGGPDIWITVQVPEGTHQVSLYFYNNDGHDTVNRDRDYLIELKTFRDNPADVERAPALASARVKDFAGGGVYKSFVVRGPSKYYLKIGKNNSFNTICSAVFIDKLLGPVTRDDRIPLPFMGGVAYEAPSTAALPPPVLAPVQEAEALRPMLAAAYSQVGGGVLEQTYRLLAYRAIVSAGAPRVLLDNWRWGLHLWTTDDRQAFLQTMARGMQSDQDPFWYVKGLHLQASASGH